MANEEDHSDLESELEQSTTSENTEENTSEAEAKDSDEESKETLEEKLDDFGKDDFETTTITNDPDKLDNDDSFDISSYIPNITFDKKTITNCIGVFGLGMLAILIVQMNLFQGMQGVILSAIGILIFAILVSPLIDIQQI